MRDGRVWVNLTDMAQATGKLVADWSRLTTTKEFISAFELNMGIPILDTNVNGERTTIGTWGIEEVAIKFAAWCSVPFEIAINNKKYLP